MKKRSEFFIFTEQKKDIIETITASLFVIGIILEIYLNEINNISKIFIWTGGGFLAALYWVLSIRPAKTEEKGIKLFFRKLSWMSYTLSVIAIILNVLFLDKADLILKVALIFEFCMFIISIILSFKEGKKYISYIVRASLYLIICGSIALFVLGNFFN